MKQNALMVVFPYKDSKTWMFDDKTVGLTREPFVNGIPEMIDILVDGLKDAERGFRLVFSSGPFPGFQAELTWEREEHGGNWYRWVERGMKGWLCPAMFAYFDEAPKRLFCKAEAISSRK